MSELISQEEMKERTRQALLDHDEKILQADLSKYFNDLDNSDDEIQHNYYEILRDSLNELYTELPDDEYLAALDAAPWWSDGQFVQFGNANDRKLFEIVKYIVNDWDPEGLLIGGAPEDEYVMEVGRICLVLKESKDIDEIAWGVYDVFCKYFGTGERKRNSVFPEYTIAAGKLMAAVKESGLDGFGHFIEEPYTIEELTILEKKLTALIETIGQKLTAAETHENMNDYLNTLYGSLKNQYVVLSYDDLKSLYEYCISEAIQYLWRGGDDVFKKIRFAAIRNMLGELWKYKSERPRSQFDFPEGLWRIYNTWDGLTEEKKLKFGEIVDVELEDLRKKANIDS